MIKTSCYILFKYNYYKNMMITSYPYIYYTLFVTFIFLGTDFNIVNTTKTVILLSNKSNNICVENILATMFTPASFKYITIKEVPEEVMPPKTKAEINDAISDPITVVIIIPKIKNLPLNKFFL